MSARWRTLAILLAAALAPPTWSQGGSCGSCPALGSCPPNDPLVPFSDHSCEDHAGHAHPGATLAFVDLTQADLRGADLSFASFTAAILSLADLSNADLSFAGGLAFSLGPARYNACTDFTGTGFDPVAAGWISTDPQQALVACPPELSLAAGGTQQHFLDASPAQAGKPYLLLGSASGTAPGIIVDGLLLPLNPDAYFLFTLQAPGSPPLSGSLGTLDAAGRATAAVVVPAGTSAALAGIDLVHAFVVLDVQGSGQVALASEAVGLELLP